ncbi:MAG: transposase [Anaerolineae bacterium]|nr:transposase [Anaerolineae bacterium]
MPYDSWKHHRRSIRLPGYDYTQSGMYFVTLCTHNRGWLFGEIIGDQMHLNAWGQIVTAEWERTPQVRPYITLDAYVVMPNHLHGIIIINDTEVPVVGASGPDAPTATHRLSTTPPDAPTATHKPSTAPSDTPTQTPPNANPKGPAKGSIGAIIAQFKRQTTVAINRQRDTPAAPVWQRNYYEHIIRNENSFNTIRLYVETNPAQWIQDSLYTPLSNHTRT